MVLYYIITYFRDPVFKNEDCYMGYLAARITKFNTIFYHIDNIFQMGGGNEYDGFFIKYETLKKLVTLHGIKDLNTFYVANLFFITPSSSIYVEKKILKILPPPPYIHWMKTYWMHQKKFRKFVRYSRRIICILLLITLLLGIYRWKYVKGKVIIFLNDYYFKSSSSSSKET